MNKRVCDTKVTHKQTGEVPGSFYSSSRSEPVNLGTSRATPAFFLLPNAAPDISSSCSCAPSLRLSGECGPCSCASPPPPRRHPRALSPGPYQRLASTNQPHPVLHIPQPTAPRPFQTTRPAPSAERCDEGWSHPHRHPGCGSIGSPCESGRSTHQEACGHLHVCVPSVQEDRGHQSVSQCVPITDRGFPKAWEFVSFVAYPSPVKSNQLTAMIGQFWRFEIVSKSNLGAAGSATGGQNHRAA